MSRENDIRLEALKKLLLEGKLSTQEELRERLEKQDFSVNQSTISRDLRRLGAVRATDALGRTVYRLPDVVEAAPATALSEMVVEIATNGSLIVIRTAVGSAPLVARHLDRTRPKGILGTLAGDDTIFVAPSSTAPREIKKIVNALRNVLR